MDNNQAKNTDSQFISFQDFPEVNQSSSVNHPQFDLGTPTQQAYGNLSNDSTGIGILEDLQGIHDKNEEPQQPSFWTIEYYQKFFNVTTDVVVERIKRSMLPHDSYLVTRIRPKPDLYGPFWVSTTLVFATAISVNIANYLQTETGSKYHWRYNFNVVSIAATCIFLYAWLLPLLLWISLKWTTSNTNAEEELTETTTSPELLELLCLYGYSLSIFVPVTFLWTIQIGWLQWVLVAVAGFLSGGVLLRSLSPVIGGKRRIIYISIILGLHLLLATGLMLYFFHVPSTSHHPQPLPSSVNVTTVTTPAIPASQKAAVIIDKTEKISKS